MRVNVRPLPALVFLAAMLFGTTALCQEPVDDGPPPASLELLRDLQLGYDSQARILDFNGAERYAFTYQMRYQESKTFMDRKLMDAFTDPQGQLIELSYRNGLFFIADEPHMRLILQMLEMFDNPSPQVQIECKIVEITHSDDFEWGVNWYQSRGLERNPLTGEVSPNIATDSAYTFFRGATGLFDPDSFISSNSPGGAPFQGGSLNFSNADPDNIGDIGRYDIIIRALEDTGRGQLLSQPSILATVNQRAFINVGEQVPVPTISEKTNYIQTSIEFKPVGIQLDVTPLIIAEDQITLRIKPEVSFVIEFVLIGVSGVSSPRISSREVESTVSVRDGEAIVIGGLIETQETTDENKFPLLGDIPLVGNLFKNYRKRNEKTEVFFFLEPHIVTNQYRRSAVYVPDDSTNGR